MKFRIRISHYGFTMTELLVAMGISGIVMASSYSVYHTHQKSYAAQEQVVAMQQNLRAARYFMEREIRMAGYDPTQSAAAGIVTADENSIRVTLDITDDVATGPPDGDTDDTDEDITYSLSDSDGDGNPERSTEIGGGIPSKPVMIITEDSEKLLISTGSTNPEPGSPTGAGILSVQPLAPPSNFFPLWWKESCD